jgi:hypothetical protein
LFFFRKTPFFPPKIVIITSTLGTFYQTAVFLP